MGTGRAETRPLWPAVEQESPQHGDQPGYGHCDQQGPMRPNPVFTKALRLPVAVAVGQIGWRIASKRACFHVTRRLVDERPSLETMHAGTSRNLIMGNILVRWNLNLNSGWWGGFAIALRPHGSGVTRDTWIVQTHDRGCCFVFERDSCCQEVWLYVLLTDETSTRNFYVGRTPPQWPHTRAPSVAVLLQHLDMLVLGGLNEEGRGGVNLSVHYTGPLRPLVEDGVMHRMTRAMPIRAFWAVFWHHAANCMMNSLS